MPTAKERITTAAMDAGVGHLLERDLNLAELSTIAAIVEELCKQLHEAEAAVAELENDLLAVARLMRRIDKMRGKTV